MGRLVRLSDRIGINDNRGAFAWQLVQSNAKHTPSMETVASEVMVKIIYECYRGGLERASIRSHWQQNILKAISNVFVNIDVKISISDAVSSQTDNSKRFVANFRIPEAHTWHL
jgi:hypothetical protein